MPLLAHLARHLTSQTENLATEGLGWLLASSPRAREAFLARVAPALAPDAQGLTFRTQHGLEDGGRPDLVALDGTGRQRLHVEAKFWAGLTDRQPRDYLAALEASGVGGCLVLVVPADRVEVVWREIERRVVTERGISAWSPQGRTRSIVGGVSVSIVNWDGVLDALAEDPAPIFQEDVRQLRDLCRRVAFEAFRPLTHEELTTTSYIRVPRLGALLDAVVAELGLQVFDRKGFKAAASNGWYGRWGKLGGVVVLVHVNTWLWGVRAPTPFWLTIWATGPGAVRVAAAWEARFPGSTGDSHHKVPRRLLALPVTPGLLEDELHRELTGLLKDLGQMLADAASEVQAEPPPEEV